jgi:hypothetical protein
LAPATVNPLPPPSPRRSPTQTHTTATTATHPPPPPNAMEKSPWFKNVDGPFPTWEGPLGVKADGGEAASGWASCGRPSTQETEPMALTGGRCGRPLQAAASGGRAGWARCCCTGRPATGTSRVGGLAGWRAGTCRADPAEPAVPVGPAVPVRPHHTAPRPPPLSSIPPFPTPPLLTAAIVDLAAAGENVNEVEAAGNTPLHSAAYEGWVEGGRRSVAWPKGQQRA